MPAPTGIWGPAAIAIGYGFFAALLAHLGRLGPSPIWTAWAWGWTARTVSALAAAALPAAGRLGILASALIWVGLFLHGFFMLAGAASARRDETGNGWRSITPLAVGIAGIAALTLVFLEVSWLSRFAGLTVAGGVMAAALMLLAFRRQSLSAGTLLAAAGLFLTGLLDALAPTAGALTAASAPATLLASSIFGAGAVLIALEEERRRSHRMTEHLEELAYHDALTGLPNRRQLLEALERTIGDPGTTDPTALLLLDLDRFQTINDSLGHQFGDELLVQVGQRMREGVRAQDIVARLGNDQFAVVIRNLGDPGEVEATGEKLLRRLRSPFLLHGHELYLTASLGASLYPRDGGDAETLLRHADTAKCQAKDRGRDNLQLYSPAMSARALERIDLESDLRRALAREEFTLLYQPILNLHSGQVEGVEALIRWHHPARGPLSPGDFLGLAEAIGMSYGIDRWVLTTACREARHLWPDDGPPLRVAVNLSAPTFHHPELVRELETTLAASRLPAEALELEVTENLAMQNVEATLRALKELKELGVKVSIDDFGTGYSSLSYLRTFPIDAVKIDQSFIRDLSDTPGDTAIASAVIAMAHSLDLEVVAEGVETPEQLAFLQQERCDRVQGWLIGRPLAPGPCRRLLEQHPVSEAPGGRIPNLAGFDG